jgi:hypothetical protein
LAESPVTVTTTSTDALGAIDDKSGIVTVIAGSMVIAGLLALFVVSVMEAAVMITVEAGTVAGAL